MSHARVSPGRVEEEFSLPLFAFTVIATLGGFAAGLKLLAPRAVWRAQLEAHLWQYALVIVAVAVLNCFVEYFFHRYVLHKSVIPFLSRFYRQHTMHHSLTRIAKRRMPDGKDIPVIENIYPITQDEQKEASFFPWYTLTVFGLAVTPLLMFCQWLWPSFPWLVSGYASLAMSLVLYEVLHAIEHWSLATWMPLIENPRWGWFWRKAYSFHLRHHAVIDCNESISGFFTLPLADWAFGTCVIPETLYAEGEAWSQAKFVSPRPRWPISWFDRMANTVAANRRLRARAEVGSRQGGSILGQIFSFGGRVFNLLGTILLFVVPGRMK